ncbi:MAG: hemerythrin domain-containing protein [Bacteroidales bacterium]|nr:hemerythrin domain-containing protein [Bacteroidales bacterium]
MKKLDKRMKMAELVESDYHLLKILSRLGIGGSFAERSVEEICRAASLSADTFILICSVYSSPDFRPTAEMLRNCSLCDLLTYLHNSHDDYVNRELKSLAESLRELTLPCTVTSRNVIRKFFDDCSNGLIRHFSYEEQVVIPYLRSLMEGKRRQDYSIAVFEENHGSIDETVSDLKNLIMKSLPRECDDALRARVLWKIFSLQEDLLHHTYIENSILVPVARLLEGRNEAGADGGGNGPGNDSAGVLSRREEGVLKLVAKGLLNKEIADALNISVNTVITHRKNITRKTGIRTVPGLTAYAILNGLVDINSIE